MYDVLGAVRQRRRILDAAMPNTVALDQVRRHRLVLDVREHASSVDLVAELVGDDPVAVLQEELLHRHALRGRVRGLRSVEEAALVLQPVEPDT